MYSAGAPPQVWLSPAQHQSAGQMRDRRGRRLILPLLPLTMQLLLANRRAYRQPHLGGSCRPSGHAQRADRRRKAASYQIRPAGDRSRHIGTHPRVPHLTQAPDAGGVKRHHQHHHSRCGLVVDTQHHHSRAAARQGDRLLLRNHGPNQPKRPSSVAQSSSSPLPPQTTPQTEIPSFAAAAEAAAVVVGWPSRSPPWWLRTLQGRSKPTRAALKGALAA